jgi:hypothetical protein
MLRACTEFISLMVLRSCRGSSRHSEPFFFSNRLGHSVQPQVLRPLPYDLIIRNTLIPLVPQRQGEIAGIPSTIGLSLIGDG